MALPPAATSNRNLAELGLLISIEIIPLAAAEREN
jgi:hypothetical protein